MGDTESFFYTTKLRWPIEPQILKCWFNLDKFEYTFEKTDKLKTAEKNKYGSDGLEWWLESL
jgi:hypothetical protein